MHRTTAPNPLLPQRNPTGNGWDCTRVTCKISLHRPCGCFKGNLLYTWLTHVYGIIYDINVTETLKGYVTTTAIFSFLGKTCSEKQTKFFLLTFHLTIKMYFWKWLVTPHNCCQTGKKVCSTVCNRSFSIQQIAPLTIYWVRAIFYSVCENHSLSDVIMNLLPGLIHEQNFPCCNFPKTSCLENVSFVEDTNQKITPNPENLKQSLSAKP